MENELADTMQHKVVQYESPNQADLLRRANSRLVMAERFEIKTPAQYALAAEELSAVKARAKELESQRMAITRPLDVAKKNVMDLFRAPLALLDRAETIYKDRLKAFAAEQARIAAEERLRLEAAADEERKRLTDQAAAEQAAGNTGVAAVLEQMGAMIIAPEPASAVPKVDTLSSRESWSFEIENEAVIPREFLSVDLRKIRAIVNVQKASTRIDGVRVFRDDVLASK